MTEHEKQLIDEATDVIKVERVTDWSLVREAARSTMWKLDDGKEPTQKWKRSILLADHSPIRCLQFWIQLKVPYCVSVHYVRHKHGVEHFVSSQRNDRQSNYDRHAARQDAPVVHSMLVNAEEIMFISKRRLCNQASETTRAVWKKVVMAIREIGEVELADLCQPMCWWYGNRCPEMKPCGFCCSMGSQLDEEGFWS